MGAIFTAIITQPLYNTFIFLIDHLPFLDAGMVVILFTCIVKIILLPLSIKASKSQIQMKAAEKDLQAIKDTYKNNTEEIGRKTIEYYKEHHINPFVSFFILLVQLPIIIGLYTVFLKSGLPEVNKSLLYAFMNAPAAINMMFLGLINIAGKNIWLAVAAGVSTYLQVHVSGKQNQAGGTGTQAEIMKAMSTQMKYVFPIIVIFISYGISSALSIYWVTSNIFAIAQEYYIQKKYHKTVIVV